MRVETRAQIISRVAIGEGTVVDENSVIKGPMVIGKNCVIRNSYIGPYTSIGNGCVIEDTDVEDSVIMDGTIIKSGGRIIESLLGREVKIVRKEGHPHGRKLILGDHSQVLLQGE